MRFSIWFALVNLAAVASLAGVWFAFQAGMLAPGNALFGALSVFCLFTGFQLLAREGMPMVDALRSMAFEPGSYPSHALGYIAYLVSAALGLGIVAVTAGNL